MKRIFNFNAGPSTLALAVLEKAQQEFVDYQGKGMSILEMSHRSPEYSEVHEQAISLVKELLELPENYTVLYLGGGATLQFSMIPLNLLTKNTSCDFTLTGTWAKKALADAEKVGHVNVVFDGSENNFTRLPDPAELQLDRQSAYLHLTSNETIEGLQWQTWPDAGNVPIVCDMSSDIMSRRLPIEKFGLIYAGAQKNLGPAGVTLVIIRDDVLDACATDLTAYLSYHIHVKKNSMYNTPPVFAIYIIKLVLEGLKQMGGILAAEKLCEQRSSLLYSTINQSAEFYRCPVPGFCRSKMNVVFRLPSEDLEKTFIAEAAQQGMGGLKGHRSVGGCRASIYNSMPIEGVKALTDFMQDFAARHA